MFPLSFGWESRADSRGAAELDAKLSGLEAPAAWTALCLRHLGSVLNKDSNADQVVIQDFRIEGGLDGQATLLAERYRVEAD
jgi:hypothetical protein